MAKDNDMDYGDDFITIVDEDGKEYELELLDTISYQDNFYMCMVPADMDEDDEDFGLIILRCGEDEKGESILSSIDDENELDTVYELFMQRIEDDEAEEAEDAED